MPEIGKIISGFRTFKATTFPKQQDVIRHLIEQGQKPSTLVISCADIRLSPREIFATNPGELYIINNIGGLIPKFGTDGIAGILSALEYAVNELQVENIIVLGHAQCAGIKMMMSEEMTVSHKSLSEPMKTWLSVAQEARDAVKAQLADKSEEEQISACEHEAIIITMRNLMTYPYIKKRMDQNKLNIFGWRFDIENGSIYAFNPDTKFFEEIS